MQGTQTVGGGLQLFIRFLGEVAFAWIPGTVASLTGMGVGSNPPLSLITQPVTYGDVVDYIQTTAGPYVYSDIFQKWELFLLISTIMTLVGGTFLAYCVIRLVQVRKSEYDYFYALAHPVAKQDVPRSMMRWQRILDEVSSDNPKRWRLAILEADIMLNELLDTLGYRGETMADKMRAVERADFNSIDLAWDAHRMRNRVAHEGEAMQLTEREARSTIQNYQRVFQEFNFV